MQLVFSRSSNVCGSGAGHVRLVLPCKPCQLCEARSTRCLVSSIVPGRDRCRMPCRQSVFVVSAADGRTRIVASVVSASLTSAREADPKWFPRGTPLPRLVFPTPAPLFRRGETAVDKRLTPVQHPLRFSSPRNVRQILSQTSCSSQSCNRRQHVAGEGYSAGRSCHLAPLRAIHKMPSSTLWLSLQGRPPRLPLWM
jgi:hypothetical protein